ncbi:hypothetical protein DMENIID0001_087690 [Sergentomyia squamirostris]
MSRYYSADEFEEAILKNSKSCIVTLKERATSDSSDTDSDDEKPQESDFMEEYKVKAMFQKLNTNPDIPGQLSKPDPLFYDLEIQKMLEEAQQLGVKQGRSIVIGNSQKPSSPVQLPETTTENAPIIIPDSPDSCSGTEKSIITPEAILDHNQNKPGQEKEKSPTAPAEESIETIVISSSDSLESVIVPKAIKLKPKKKFLTPKEVYQLKKGVKPSTTT